MLLLLFFLASLPISITAQQPCLGSSCCPAADNQLIKFQNKEYQVHCDKMVIPSNNNAIKSPGECAMECSKDPNCIGAHWSPTKTSGICEMQKLGPPNRQAPFIAMVPIPSKDCKAETNAARADEKTKCDTRVTSAVNAEKTNCAAKVTSAVNAEKTNCAAKVTSAVNAEKTSCTGKVNAAKKKCEKDCKTKAVAAKKACDKRVNQAKKACKKPTKPRPQKQQPIVCSQGTISVINGVSFKHQCSAMPGKYTFPFANSSERRRQIPGVKELGECAKKCLADWGIECKGVNLLGGNCYIYKVWGGFEYRPGGYNWLERI